LRLLQRVRLIVPASAIAIVVDPAMAMATPDIRTANHATNHTANHTANNGARRTGNDHAAAAMPLPAPMATPSQVPAWTAKGMATSVIAMSAILKTRMTKLLGYFFEMKTDCSQ
jgi:hypothetical protein